MPKNRQKNNNRYNWILDFILGLLILLLLLGCLLFWASFFGIPIGKYIVTANLKNHSLIFTNRDNDIIYRCPNLNICNVTQLKIPCPETISENAEYTSPRFASGISSSTNAYIPSLPSRITYNSLMPSYYTLAYYDVPGQKAILVEILEDQNNGTSYSILLPTAEQKWVSSEELSSFTTNKPTVSKLSPTDKNILIRETKLSSSSEYLLWVDLARLEVNVFKSTPNSNDWFLQEVFPCSAGALKTPTKRGLFFIQDRGLSFEDEYAYKNWLRYNGSYLIHSIPYHKGSNIPKNITKPLQNRDSNGCITVSLNNSKWLYDNIPEGTTIFVN